MSSLIDTYKRVLRNGIWPHAGSERAEIAEGSAAEKEDIACAMIAREWERHEAAESLYLSEKSVDVK